MNESTQERKALNIKQPERVKHSYIQTLTASPEQVFPLLCPVMEKEWVSGWIPELVISESGVAEKDCIFITPAEPENAIWVVTQHDPDAYKVEMLKITPGHTVGKLEIALADDGNQGTKATVSYEYTALSSAGTAFLQGFTDAAYLEFMKNWENALNHYLATGEIIA